MSSSATEDSQEMASTSQIQQQQQQQQKTTSKRAAEEITATPEKGARSEKKVPEEGPSATEDGRTEVRKKGWRVVWESHP